MAWGQGLEGGDFFAPFAEKYYPTLDAMPRRTNPAVLTLYSRSLLINSILFCITKTQLFGANVYRFFGTKSFVLDNKCFLYKTVSFPIIIAFPLGYVVYIWRKTMERS